MRWIVLMLMVLAFLPGLAQNNPHEERIRSLSEKLRCLVCQNQTLADSPATLAVDLRRQLDEQVKAGKSDEQILEFMVQRYGDFVLYDPPFKATTLLLWAGPFVLLAVACAVVLAILRRRRDSAEQPPLAAQDKRLVDEVLQRDRQGGAQ